MWQFQQSPRFELADARSFLAALNRQAGFFSPAAPVYAARAPGRLDLMGGIADYSGSLVLELPLAAGTWVAVQAAEQPTVTVRTVPGAGFEGRPSVERPLQVLAPRSEPLSYEAAHRLLTGDGQEALVGVRGRGAGGLAA